MTLHNYFQGNITLTALPATKPGIDKVGFQVFDTSTNGVNSGPIHTPSARIEIYFQAGVNVESIEPDEDHTHVRFDAMSGILWRVKTSTRLGPQANWLPVGNPVSGDDYFHEIVDGHAVHGNRFYRLTGIPEPVQ